MEPITRRETVRGLATAILAGSAGASVLGAAPLALAEDQPAPSITLDTIRDYVIGIDEPVELADGTSRPLINFDNAATTPALTPVAEAVNECLLTYGSIGRGFSQKSDISTDTYNAIRSKVLDFVGADPERYTCFYANNTTDGLNKLASALVGSPSDVVMVTRMEHHANDLPWRNLCNVLYTEVGEDGRLDLSEFDYKLAGQNVKYVSVTAASNVTGYVNDVHEIARIAHMYGAKIIVDGAQIVAHRQFSMLGQTREEDIDFFVFSAHKMYSPFGGGAVVGLTDVLDEHVPRYYGGGMIKLVADDWQRYKEAPARYEAGSPNYPGVIGLSKAIDILQGIGFDAIQAHEQALIRKLVDGLLQFDNVIVYGDTDDLSDRVGVVTFNFTDTNSYLLAEKLAQLGGIATRRGAFCANPYVWRLTKTEDIALYHLADCGDMSTPGMVRISFGIYNTEEEIDEFLAILPEARVAAQDLTGYGNVSPEY